MIPALQKALDDPSLEVVVEAAESLGTLGAPEAGPVLTVLLRHPSRSARQTAALALERVADVGVLDGLLQALDDPETADIPVILVSVMDDREKGFRLGAVDYLVKPIKQADLAPAIGFAWQRFHESKALDSQIRNPQHVSSL